MKKDIADKWRNIGETGRILPLYTKQSLADRWGVNRQTVQNWSARHEDFCKPLDGIVSGCINYYPLYEVQRYEKGRGLKNDLQRNGEKQEG